MARHWSAVLAAAFAISVLASCGGDAASPQTQSSASSRAEPSSSSSERGGKSKDDEGDSGGGGKVCPTPKEAPSGASATTTAINDQVDVVEYPLPDYDAKLWTQWGQGIVAGGKFFSAVGDECGINGDSFVYEFDPATSTLRLLDDVFSVVPHEDGAFGYGKMHAQMVRGFDGAVYGTTYWGARDDLTFESGYGGDVLLRIDPATGAITNLGVPVPRHGVPTLAASPDGTLLFGEAPDPLAELEEGGKRGLFFVYDLRARKVLFQMDKPDGAPGYRSILVDARGRAWFSVGDGQVAIYDPATNTAETSGAAIPGEFLRAATGPAPDGTVYGVTEGEVPTFFKVDRDGKLETMGPARGYTASLALSPDGRTVYYVPDAHGSAYKEGTPVIALDTASGEERVVVKLNDLVEPKIGLRLGGTYDVVLSEDGRTLFVGLNAGPPDSKSTFGVPVLAAVKV